MNINSVTNLGGGLGSLGGSPSLDESGSSAFGDFSSIIQQQINKLSSTEILKKTYGDKVLTAGEVGLSIEESLAVFSPIQHPSELETFCNALDALFKDKDVISFLELSGTQLDQWDAFYAKYTQGKKEMTTLVEASRSQLYQLLQAKGPTQAIFDEITTNLDNAGKEVEQGKLEMLYSLNKIFTPEQMAKTITLVEETLFPGQSTDTATAA